MFFSTNRVESRQDYALHELKNSGQPYALISKIIRFNILALVLLITTLPGLFAREANGQDLSQTQITLGLKSESLLSALKKIEQQTSYHFVYRKKELKDISAISLPVETRSITRTLELILAQTPFDYKLINQNILIIPRSEAAQTESPKVTELTPAEHSIRGKVTDANGEGLPGVNITLKGTSKGTQTNEKGSYEIAVPESGAILVFSFIGYLTKEIEVKNQSTLDIQLLVDTRLLEEVVVVGYGTQKRSDLTGSVVRADLTSFKESPNFNILQSLQGTVPGLSIGQINEAGADPSISIRGKTTISGNSLPLVVVDGIIYHGSLASFHPNDIESVDILKDASSRAIYGAQAANGVILITTKKGKSNEKPVINYSASFATQNPLNPLTYQNREEFIKKISDVNWREAYIGPDSTTPNPNFDPTKFWGDQPILDGYRNGTDYDWWNAVTNPGHLINHNLSLSGRTDKTSYFISGGYTNQKGFVINDLFKRTTTRVNLENQVFKWFTLGVQAQGSFSDYSGDSPTLSSAVNVNPLVSPYDSNGELVRYPLGSGANNPLLASHSDDYDRRNNLLGNFYGIVNFPFLSGLSYRINFGNNYRWNRRNNANEYGSGFLGRAYKSNESAYDWLLDNILTYKTRLNKDNNLDVTLVYGRNERTYDNSMADGIDYKNLGLGYNSLQQAQQQYISSSAWKEASLYQMARINYDFKSRYFLTATFRRDGFSGFAANKKTVIFPSVGAGWTLSKEEFLANDFIDLLKLRASYGSNGNLVNRYASLAVVQSGASYVFGDGGSTLLGQEITSLANPNLTWETTKGLNLGLDFSVLAGRISGNVEYYSTKTTNLIFDVSLPVITGFSQITTNLGRINNRGIEFVINTQNIHTEQFQWNTSFNFSRNINKVVSLIGLDQNGDGKEDDLVASNLFIGQSLGTVYGYKLNGLYQINDEIPTGWSPGTERIVDLNGDGRITTDDRQILGKEEPAYRFGFQNTFSFKGFSLNTFFYSIQGGNNGYLGTTGINYRNSSSALVQNIFREFDYWSPSNPNAEFHLPGAAGAIVPEIYKNRSFVRLQDISLAYTFNPNLIQKLKIQNLKLFVSGKNLATWTSWKGWDPETGQGLIRDGRPVLKSYSVGIDITF